MSMKTRSSPIAARAVFRHVCDQSEKLKGIARAKRTRQYREAWATTRQMLFRSRDLTWGCFSCFHLAGMVLHLVRKQASGHRALVCCINACSQQVRRLKDLVRSIQWSRECHQRSRFPPRPPQPQEPPRRQTTGSLMCYRRRYGSTASWVDDKVLSSTFSHLFYTKSLIILLKKCCYVASNFSSPSTAAHQAQSYIWR